MVNLRYLTIALHICKVSSTPPISIASRLVTGTSCILTQKQAHPHLLASHRQVLCPREPGCLQYVLYKFHPHLFCLLILFPARHPSAANPQRKSLGPPKRLYSDHLLTQQIKSIECPTCNAEPRSRFQTIAQEPCVPTRSHLLHWSHP
jgi:hypothetical protein